MIGVDSGGSVTRALAVSLAGERVAYAETGGGHPFHDAAAGENLREAIRRVTEGHEAVRLVAGVAGLDRPEDEARVAEATAFLACPRMHVNDLEVAHFAAFGDGPGIVTVQGTGSNVRARLEDGRIVFNGDFMHYAPAGAVRLGIAGVQILLTQPRSMRDEALWASAYRLWEADSPESLRAAVAQQRGLSEVERSRRHGEFARAITASAEAGWLHSASVVGAAAREIARGVRLIGPMFEAEEVPVATVGACVRSPAMRASLGRWLAKATEKRYAIFESKVAPIEGAVRMALREEGLA